MGGSDRYNMFGYSGMTRAVPRIFTFRFHWLFQTLWSLSAVGCSDSSWVSLSSFMMSFAWESSTCSSLKGAFTEARQDKYVVVPDYQNLAYAVFVLWPTGHPMD